MPETIELDEQLARWHITREGLADLAILGLLCHERSFSRDRVNAALERAFPPRALF